jgi:hypothetical protein
MRIVKYFWRPETAIFVGLWLLLLVAGRSRLFSDPGSLWHIVVGQRILSSGRLLHTDPFSFTCAGQPWIAQWWLAECGLALLHQVGGLDTVLLATVTLVAGLYTWVAHRLLRAGVHPLLALAIVCLAMAASSYHFHPRPHLLSILLLGVTFARLCDFEAGRISPRGLLWLLPLFLFWTNVHGGMVGGLATLALTVAGWGVARLMGRESPVASLRQFVFLVALTLACGLTAFVNPYGAELPRVWFALIGSPVLPRLMSEHAPLRQSGPEGWPVVVFGLVYAVALLGVLPRWPRVTWLLPLVWGYLAWTRIRHGPLFAITAALALGDMLPHVRWAARLAERGSQVFRLRPAGPAAKGERAAWGWVLIPAALVLVALVLQLAAVPVPVLGHGWAELDPAHWPVELLPDLREYEHSRPDGTPVFNEMLFGGFLIYYTPGLRVFIDDRCELYGDDRLLAYVEAVQHEPAQIERWAREYGFEMALVHAGSVLDHYLRGTSGWRLVRETEAAALYVRRQ